LLNYPGEISSWTVHYRCTLHTHTEAVHTMHGAFYDLSLSLTTICSWWCSEWFKSNDLQTTI